MASDTRRTAEEKRKALTHYLGKARTVRSSEGYEFKLDVTRLQRAGEAVTNELSSAQKTDGTPALLTAEDFKPLTWHELIDAVLQHGYAVVGEVAAVREKQASTAPAVTLSSVLDRCDEERKRLVTAIAGNHADKVQAKALSSAIFGGRAVNRTRPGYEAEFETIIASINALPECPSAVRHMVPRLEAVLKTLKALPPSLPGRPSKAQSALPHPSVQESTLALHLALGDLLAQAGWAATDQRLASLTRVIVGRKKEEAEKKTEEGAPQTPEQKAAAEAAKAEKKKGGKKKAEENKGEEKKGDEKQPPAPGAVASGTAGQAPAATGKDAPAPAPPAVQSSSKAQAEK